MYWRNTTIHMNGGNRLGMAKQSSDTIFSFLWNGVLIVVCPFIPFLLVIVLPVLLRCSDYPFGVLNLFLSKKIIEKESLEFRFIIQKFYINHRTVYTQISEKGCECKWTWETIQHYILTQVNKIIALSLLFYISQSE